jgi:YVTN family beta-propeller protein
VLSFREFPSGNPGYLENTMRKLSIAFFLLLLSGLSAMGQDAVSSPSSTLAYVLDPVGQTIAAVDIAGGKTIASTPVSGKDSESLFHPGVDTLLLTPDKSRLVRLRTGASKMTFRYGFHPQEKSSATIIDAKTMQVAAEVDLGWGLTNYYLTPDKKVLITIASGYQSQKPEETLPGEIILTNVSSGQTLGRLALPRPPSNCLISKDGATAVLLFAQQNQKGSPLKPAELQFVSIEKQAIAGSITLDGAPDMPLLSPDGKYVYLMEKGQPSNKPEKNVNGRIQVIAMKEMKVAAILDAGSDPKGVLADDAAGQTLILSSGQPVKGEKDVDGELRVLRGASISGLVKVGAAPRFIRFSPDRKRLYVLGWDDLTAIDYASLHELGRIHLSGSASELAVSPDGNRGFVLFPGSSKMSILDLQALKEGASVTTGRGGIKFAKNLGAIAATAASATAAYGQAYNMAATNGGYGFATYQIFTVAPANTSISVRPDGAFVYVLNSETNDVTIVDANTSSVVDKIAAGGQRLLPLTNGGVLAVVARNTLHLIDTSSQKALPEVHFDKNLEDISLSPDGRVALALVEGSLVLLDGTTGNLRGRIEGFKRPRIVVFAQDDSAPPSSPSL